MDFIARNDVKLLIALGNNKKTSVKGEYLLLRTPETMSNLSKKLFEAFNFIKDNYQFDYLIKCDDDITIKNFEETLQLFQKRDYSGIIRKTTKKRALLWATKNNLHIDANKHVETEYALGTMFCMSKKAFVLVLKELPTLVKYHTKYLGGNNDTLVGRAFENVKSKNNLTTSTFNEIKFFEQNIIEDFDFRKISFRYILTRLKYLF